MGNGWLRVVIFMGFVECVGTRFFGTLMTRIKRIYTDFYFLEHIKNINWFTLDIYFKF